MEKNLSKAGCAQAEPSSRENDDRYRWLAELSPDGIVVHTDGQIAFANQSFAQIVGADTPDELIGKPILDFIDPEQHKDVLERRKKAESGVMVALAEARFLRRDGSVTHVERVVSPIIWEDKPSFLVIVHDINERVRAEAALRKSEERYELAVKGSNAGLWDWDIVTNDHYFSPRWEDTVGYAEGDLDPHIDTFFALIHPDDSDHTRQAVDAHLKDRVPYDQEYRLRHKDGSYVWVHAAGQAVWDTDGNPVRMAGSITDISDRKRAEQALSDSETRYRQLAEMSPDGMFVHVDGEIVYANDRLAQILAIPSPQDLLDTQAIDLPAPEYRDQIKHLRAVVMEGGIAQLKQSEFLRSDGSRVPVERSGARIIWEGKPAILVLVRDVSERMAAEEALRESVERLRDRRSLALGDLPQGHRRPVLLRQPSMA